MRGEMERPSKQASVRRARPGLGNRKQDNVVGPVVVSLEVHLPRNLGRHREGLEDDSAIDKARYVDVRTPRPHEEIAAPQERIGMKVGDPKGGVQLPRVSRDV